MHTEFCDYTDGDVTCEAFIALDKSKSGKRPAVLVSHAWAGQGEFERQKARDLAELGYVGIAIDLYGKGKRGGTAEQNTALMQPFIDDRVLLKKRITAALIAAKGLPEVDGDKIGAIGFCFGGLCVLDLARSTAPGVKGVVSFHGLFYPPNIGAQAPIGASILILHGYDDPMATPDQLVSIASELTEAKADFQIHAYGHTVHGFSNPSSNMPDRGIVYNATAERRALKSMKDFLAEVLV